MLGTDAPSCFSPSFSVGSKTGWSLYRALPSERCLNTAFPSGVLTLHPQPVLISHGAWFATALMPAWPSWLKHEIVAEKTADGKLQEQLTGRAAGPAISKPGAGPGHAALPRSGEEIRRQPQPPLSQFGVFYRVQGKCLCNRVPGSWGCAGGDISFQGCHPAHTAARLLVC